MFYNFQNISTETVNLYIQNLITMKDKNGKIDMDLLMEEYLECQF